MKSSKQLRICSYLGLAPLLLAGAVQAADLGKAKATVDNIRQSDPPRVSTSTRTPEQAIREYTNSGKPTGPQSLHTREVPSPVNRNNPQNDPDVQRGFDAHQRAHGK
jgi:hypothetical protein